LWEWFFPELTPQPNFEATHPPTTPIWENKAPKTREGKKKLKNQSTNQTQLDSRNK